MEGLLKLKPSCCVFIKPRAIFLREDTTVGAWTENKNTQHKKKLQKPTDKFLWSCTQAPMFSGSQPKYSLNNVIWGTTDRIIADFVVLKVVDLDSFCSLLLFNIILCSKSQLSFLVWKFFLKSVKKTSMLDTELVLQNYTKTINRTQYLLKSIVLSIKDCTMNFKKKRPLYMCTHKRCQHKTCTLSIQWTKNCTLFKTRTAVQEISLLILKWRAK